MVEISHHSSGNLCGGAFGLKVVREFLLRGTDYMSNRVRGVMVTCWTAIGMAALVSSAAAQPAPTAIKPDVTLGSRPDTVIWGYLSARVAPVLRIKSGTTVPIDTISQQGLLTKDDARTLF